MKKVKKLLALIMAMTMVLGMAMTVSAAPSTEASITIYGLTAGETTEIKVIPVAVWDSDLNEWKVSDWVSADDFEPGMSSEEVNWDGLKEDSSEADPDSIKTVTTTNSTETIEGLDIGMYLVLATATIDGEPATVYEVMGAVTYTYDDNDNLIGPLDATLYAKGSDYHLAKTFSTGSQNIVAGIGESVSYDITTVFPGFGKNETNRSFTITDEPTGINITDIKVYVNDMENELVEGYQLLSDGDSLITLPTQENVTISFTEGYIGTVNEHAGQQVKIVVTATVIAPTYSNDVKSSHSSDDVPTVEGETGSMVITKKDAETKETLKGAIFTIEDSLVPGTLLAFKWDSDLEAYVLTNEEVDGKTVVTDLEVNDQGVLKVLGLSDGTYVVTEKKAPNGYSTTPIPEKTITLVDADGDATDKALTLKFDVMDSKLASLPETGGIGTTIFTIGGCAIMIAAAALYFVNRRKSEEN